MTASPDQCPLRGPRADDEAVDALAEHLRSALPPVAPFAVWRSQELTEAHTGRRYILPLVVLTRNGLWLLHVDSRAGALDGDDTLWHHTAPAGAKRTAEAPLASLKAKAEALRDALAPMSGSDRLPRAPKLRVAVVLTGAVQVEPGLAAHPDLICARGDRTAVDRLVDALGADPPPDAQDDIVRSGDSPLVAAALAAAGLADASRRVVKGYRLGELLEDHETWQEHRAVHATDPSRTARVRTWILPRGRSEAERATLGRAVRTESRILDKLGHHPSILGLLDVDDDTPPRLLFEDFDGLPLDRFLRAHPDLSFDERLSIVLTVGDALVHCHREEVCHRNLSPASVLARRTPAGIDLRLHRFEGAQADSAQDTRLGTRHPSAFGGRMEELYRAPEVFQAAQDADASADLFSLGALAWFLFTGKHPGPSLADRGRRIQEDEGLRLWRELDSADDALDDLIAAATRLLPHDRALGDAPLTVPRFLDRLRQLYRDESTDPAVDPLAAGVGDLLATTDGDLPVIGVLGTGATSRVLHVETGTGTAALKLPLAPRFAAHLDAEAHALARLDHEHIVRLLGRPQLETPTGTITGLLLQFAGEQSLADRVRAEGALSLDFCARLGDQLLSAVAHLHERGVGHRDLKPANLAFATTGKQAWKLLVFDFSLAAIDKDDVGAGTRGWRDPFLGQHRWTWDDAADLYGAAACLYFALTGERPHVPSRGDGRVRVEETRFDATVRGGLAQFFTRAFAPTLAERHADAEAMRDAWRALFDGDTTSVITDPGATSPADAAELRRRARLDTGVARLGLSARAVNGLERAGVFDVRDLLALPKNRLSAVRGVGTDTLRQIQDAVRELSSALGSRPDATTEPFVGPLPGLPRALDAADLPPELLAALDDDARTTLRDAGLRTTHDLALHSAAGVVRLLGLTPEAATALRRALRDSAPATPITGPIATWVRVLLSPNPPSRRGRWEDRLRMLTGLDPMPGDAPLGGRTTAAAAAACGDSPALFRASFHNAREHWRKHRAEADAAVAAVLEALGGPAAPIEPVARALLAAHAPTAPVDDDALRQAAALVRFATELDLPAAPLAWRLIGGAAWVAPDAGTLAALEHAAAALTAAVDPELPLTGEAAARAVADHVADTPLAALPPAALLELLVLAAPDLALSSRAEVYAAALPAHRAVALAAPVLQQGALTPADVHKRVRGRFPRGEPLPDRPALDLLLTPLRLEWSTDKGRYLRPDTAAASLSRTRGTRMTTASVGSPAEVEATRFRLDLQRSLESGGFAALQVNARDAEKARRLLVRELPELQVTSLDHAVYTRLVARVAATPGAQIDPILELERSRTPAATYAQLLDLFVRPVLDELVTDLLAARLHRPQLLVHPGLLARYDAAGPLDRLVRTASDQGHGAVWLLLPAYDDGAPPTVHHPDRALPVPLTRPSQSLRVPRRWLAIASS